MKKYFPKGFRYVSRDRSKEVRNLLIRMYRDHGFTFKRIGEIFLISTTRVQQITHKGGLV